MQYILIALKFFFLVLSIYKEKNDAKKKKLKAAFKEACNAVETEDDSALTAAFDSINNA